jgi:uncharacterized protein (DUF885 family)
MEDVKNTQEVDEAKSAESSTPDFDSLLQNPDVAKRIQSMIDAGVSKGVESYKEKGFTKAVEQEVEQRLKARETKTPEQIKFEEYEAKLAAMQDQLAQKERLEMRTKNKEAARAKIKEVGVPDDLLDFVVSEDSEKTNNNLEKYIASLSNFKNQIKQEILKGNNIKVPGANTETGAEPDLSKMTKDQVKAYLKSHT